MSNPIDSLKKVKRTPLFLPEMSKNSPKTEEKTDKIDTGRNSRMFDFNMGYTKNSPRSVNNSNRMTASFSKIGESNQVPFKTKIDDSDLIDEFTTKMAADNMKRNIMQNRSISTDKNSLKTQVPPTDMDLMQIMMSKIKVAESRCAYLEKENREKDKTIRILKDKLNLVKQSNDVNRTDAIDKLEERNLELEEKICEMEEFLSDYGLVWIGNRTITGENMTTDRKENKHYIGGKFRCDYDLILRNVKELNSLMESTSSDREIVEFGRNGAKFETSSNTIKLALYANGIALYDGPFRPFDDSLAQKFCIDIMDGYFPSELQIKHPDGVRFEPLVDKRDVTYRSDTKSARLKATNSVFRSKGYRLGSGRPSDDDDQLEDTPIQTDHKYVETRLTDQSPLTIEQFLQKLPSCVVRNGGNLIDIRNDLSNLIRGTNTTTTTSTTTTHQLENSSQNSGSSSRRSSDQYAQIRVKSGGDDSYMVTLKYTDTIEMLKEHIKSIRKSKSQLADFDLASIHPRKTFDNLKQTLEECNLVPNSNILLIPHRKI